MSAVRTPSAAEGSLITRKQIVEAVTGQDKLLYEAVKRLIEEGVLVEHAIDRCYFDPPPRSGPAPKIVLPTDMDLDDFLSKTKATGNQCEERRA